MVSLIESIISRQFLEACKSIDVKCKSEITHLLSKYHMGLKFSFGSLNLLISHRTPIHPGRHWQVYWLIKSVQVPPFRQGEEPHSLKSEYIDKTGKR